MKPIGFYLCCALCLVALGAAVLCSCSAAGPSCNVIRGADEACHVLQMTTPAGSVESVPVTSEDLAGLGQRVMLRRQAMAAQDAGRE